MRQFEMNEKETDALIDRGMQEMKTGITLISLDVAVEDATKIISADRYVQQLMYAIWV